MQNLGKDLDHVIGILLKGSAEERKDVLNRCFTEDAEFTHHLLCLKGREEIYALYQYWHDINLKLDFYNTNKSKPCLMTCWLANQDSKHWKNRI